MVTPLQDYKFLNKGWISMKHLGVLLLPPGQDASPMQGYPQQYVAGTHLHIQVKRDKVE